MSDLFETIMEVGGMYVEVGGYCTGEDKERCVEEVTSVRVLLPADKVSKYVPVQVDYKKFKKDFEDQINESLFEDDVNREAVHEDMMYDAWKEEQAFNNMEEKTNG